MIESTGVTDVGYRTLSVLDPETLGIRRGRDGGGQRRGHSDVTRNATGDPEEPTPSSGIALPMPTTVPDHYHVANDPAGFWFRRDCQTGVLVR